MKEVVRPATFLFAAGQETVTKLLSAGLRTLGDRPEFEEKLRADRSLIRPFLEESLRMDSPTKVDFRLARKTTTIGDVDIPAGTIVMLCLGAANRDRVSSRIRTNSSWDARTSTITWRSVEVCTPARAHRSPAWRQT